jgi:hypothetical protein
MGLPPHLFDWFYRPTGQGEGSGLPGDRVARGAVGGTPGPRPTGRRAAFAFTPPVTRSPPGGDGEVTVE